MSDNEKRPSRKSKAENEIGGEVEIFLKIFIELAIKEPEDIDKLIEKTNDNIDRPALDAIIFAVSKLRELLQSDIESLKLPNALKVSIKLLKSFMWIASAESRSVRGASHQPIFMSDCLTICHTHLLCMPREWVSFCVSGAVEVGRDAEWI